MRRGEGKSVQWEEEVGKEDGRKEGNDSWAGGVCSVAVVRDGAESVKPWISRDVFDEGAFPTALILVRFGSSSSGMTTQV